MESPFIFGGEKYKFIPEKGIISLPVKLENLPDKLVVKELTLLKRAEFHVSLVCIRKIIEKYKISIPNFENKILNDFSEFTKTKDVASISYKDEFKFVAKENKKTLVVMCEVSNLDNFFDFINKKYSLEIESPPAHVTLYTEDGESGIYLIRADDIKNFTKPIPNPIGHSL